MSHFAHCLISIILFLISGGPLYSRHFFRRFLPLFFRILVDLSTCHPSFHIPVDLSASYPIFDDPFFFSGHWRPQSLFRQPTVPGEAFCSLPSSWCIFILAILFSATFLAFLATFSDRWLHHWTRCSPIYTLVVTVSPNNESSSCTRPVSLRQTGSTRTSLPARDRSFQTATSPAWEDQNQQNPHFQ